MPTDRSASLAEPAAALPRDFLRPCLLLLLRESPAHGYDLLERISTLGYDPPDAGGLYRALRRFEKDGLVRSAWEASSTGPQRRIYQITREGMEELHGWAKSLAEGSRVIDRFLGRYEEFVALGDANRARTASGGPGFNHESG